MSGYLQRLARAARQPAESVHPLLGSVFSAPEYAKAGDSLEQNVFSVSPSEMAAPAGERSHEVPALRTAGNPLLSHVPPAHPATLQSAGQTANLDSSSTERASYRPLLTPAQNQDSKTAQREPEHDFPAVARRHEEHPERIYTPLMAETRVPSGIPTSSNLRPNAVDLSGAAKRWSSRPAEREPEEVQIHIGRIEVTAVPQAPARAAIKTIHKGQSLDEYLQRRDRRA